MSANAVASSASDVVEAVKITQTPPTVSTSFSDAYQEACARSSSRATITEALPTQFESEKLPPLSDEETFVDDLGHHQPTSQALHKRGASRSVAELEQALYTACLNRLRTRRSGAFIAEAANFAATTCWEPTFAPPRPNTSIDPNDSMQNALTTALSFPERPLFTLFLARIEQARWKYLYPVLWKHAETVSRDYLSSSSCPHTRTALATAAKDRAADPRLLYWRLCLTSRDPKVEPAAPGAVRAVIQPFAKRWVEQDGMPAAWLEAGGPRARDVYSWLGFRVVDEFTVGVDKEGRPITIWCMIYTKTPAT